MSLTPSTIVKHLKTYLPLHTSAFTDLLTVSAASMGASNILTITSTAHGKSPGQYIVITGGTTRNILTAAVLQADDTVEFTTTIDHDLTLPALPLDDETLTMAGFGSVWDGEHNIADVPNRRNFNVGLPTGETLAPTIDGNQYLVESIPTGAYPVATVPTADTFTVDLSAAPPMPVGTVDGATVISGFRIAAAANFERAKAAYSEQGEYEPYLFVIFTDADVSKNRQTLNDGIASFTQQDARLLTILQNFSTTVFIPTTTEISGANAQDLAMDSIYVALLSSLYGAPFNDNSLIKYRTVPAGHGVGEFQSAYYVHVYDWQTPYAFDLEDGFIEQSDVAFRDIAQSLAILADSEAEMTLNIALDDEPL